MNRWRETCQVRRDLITVSTKRQRIAELARNCPDMAFTNLAHHIDIEWMLTAHGHTRRDGAVGVDGQTADEYEVNLEANLQNLLDRAKSGTYVAPPVRRVHIPKAGSATETRPLGIPTYEDKILQRAVPMVGVPGYPGLSLTHLKMGVQTGRSTAAPWFRGLRCSSDTLVRTTRYHRAMSLCWLNSSIIAIACAF